MKKKSDKSKVVRNGATQKRKASNKIQVSTDEDSASGDGSSTDGDCEPTQVKKAKLSETKFYKTPTNEELGQLKETENLFKSSLFRLQIAELLTEVSLQQKKKSAINKYISDLTKSLIKLRPGEKHQLDKVKWLKKSKIKIPISLKPAVKKGQFQFLPPVAVKPIGSYPLDLVLKPDPVVDLSVVMPKECFQEKDHLNQRYLRKRALYLSTLACHLTSSKLVDSLAFTYHHGNHMRPVLVVKPSAEHGKGFSVHMHAVPEDGAFKLGRFHVNKNNIRTSWFRKEGTADAGETDAQRVSSEPATPRYNTWTARDLVEETNRGYTEHVIGDSRGVREGLALLKVWLHQRQLDVGHGCFSGYIMMMYVTYLIAKRKLNVMMSSYQIMRNTLLQLSQSDWLESGISLAPESSPATSPTVDDFKQAFDVVFIDRSGFVNLCCDMYKSTFDRVKHEASLGLRFLETPGLDGFQALFMTPVKFLHTFDQSFCIKLEDPMSCAMTVDADALMDVCNDSLAVCVPKILDVLHRSFGGRVQLIDIQQKPCDKWAVTAGPPSAQEAVSLTVGLLLDADRAHSVVDRGPPADSPQAAEFREFWGDNSELRRFQDGSICEAVFWSASTFHQRRQIISLIAKHILNRHLGIKETALHFMSSRLDTLLMLPDCKMKGPVKQYGTGEEQFLEIHRYYDELCKILRGLRDLPLAIHTIQGISPASRYAEVFPPTMSPLVTGRIAPDMDLCVPSHAVGNSFYPYTSVIQVLCMLETSGKWPEDKEAIKRVKAAFLIKIAQLLREQGVTNQITPSFLDVLYCGFVFRLEIGYLKEINISKMVTTPEGMVKMVDTPESVELQRKLIALPTLTSTLHGLQQQNNSLSSCVRLAKRWVSAHLLMEGYIKEEAIELLVASLYITPAPYAQPSSPLTGFLRFLHLLCSHDWQAAPLVVNFNQQLSSEDIAEIQTTFTRDRVLLPAMVVATPQDRSGSQWTRPAPTPQILERLVLLAQESLTVLEASLPLPNTALKQIFRPPLDPYDVIIRLEPRHLSRHHHAVDITMDTAVPKYLTRKKISKKEYLPIVEYNLALCFLHELRETYGDVALFFHDIYGGNIITVLWKPSAFQPQPFQASCVDGRLMSTSPPKEGRATVAFDIQSVIENIKILGNGIIRNIKMNTEKWTI